MGRMGDGGGSVKKKEQTMTQDYTKWFYARFEDSECWSGGFATREEAITAGRDDFDDGDSFYIARATNPPLRLADWIDAEETLGAAQDRLSDSDRVTYEFDDDAVFTAMPDQRADLTARLKQACDDWQTAHGIVFTVRTFQSMESPELVPPVVGGDQ